MSGALVDSPMRIVVNRIPFAGLREHASYDPASLDLGRSDICVEEPIHVSAFITKTEDELVVQAQIRGVLQIICARCLEPFACPVSTDATLSYEVKPTDVVDITEDVRQELLLTYPMAPLCRPNCHGLCRVCGQNLNVNACVHNLVR